MLAVAERTTIQASYGVDLSSNRYSGGHHNLTPLIELMECVAMALNTVAVIYWSIFFNKSEEMHLKVSDISLDFI